MNIPNITLPSGRAMPLFGVGSWRMGEQRSKASAEEAAIRHALEQGVRLIDTAEMYGEGEAEKIIARALDGRRDDVFIVSKVYPHNASYDGVMAACERSLRRLNTEYIDLYLLHWPGSYPLSDTFGAFAELRDQGKILEFGVSNFDVGELDEIPEEYQGELGSNQIFYNLEHREAEWAVSDWCAARNVPVMAYSPLDQGGRMLSSPALSAIGSRHGATPAQIALAWLRQKGIVAIPKSSQPKRVEENLGSLGIALTEDDLAELDRAFPSPQGPARLGMR